MKLAFTICSANYLPYAKALADSLIEHNPDYQFVIALVDNYFPSIEVFKPHTILSVRELDILELEEMNERYNIFELSCALKPFISEHLFKKYSECDALFYMDSDILIFDSLQKAEACLQTHSLIITPHLATALPYEISITTELDVLHTGIYNAGFFGLRKGAETIDFLKWWQHRLRYHCYNDAVHGLFVDQLWLSLAPLFFKGTYVLFDPGYNLAYWNFPERKLSTREGDFFVNEEYVLVFYHFSGYDFNQPDKISKHHRKGLTLKDVPEYKALFEKYREAVQKENMIEFFSLPVTMGRAGVTNTREKNFFKRKWKKFFKKPKH